MFQGKMKAVTFSFDDGVMQDIRLISLLDRYGLKGTFNLNSDKLGFRKDVPTMPGTQRVRIAADEVAQVYQNHEVAVHTLTHPNLTECSDAEIIRQVEDDRLALSKLVGYEVLGMAYPCGGVNNNDHVASVIQKHTGVKYARTITLTQSFAPQENLYRFHPTVTPHRVGFAQLDALTEVFLNLQPTSPQIFYLWGHSYEFDDQNDWDALERFFKKISGKTDIFYGTNKEILLPNQ